MDRRTFIAIAGSSVVPLAGCSDTESPVRDIDQTPRGNGSGGSGGQDPSRLGIRDVGFEGREIVIAIDDVLDQAKYIEIESETGQGGTVEVAGTVVRYEIIDPQNAGRADLRAVGPGGVTVALYDRGDTVIDSVTFQYDPEISVSARSAAQSVFQTAEVPAASAIFTFANSGTGPTYLSSVEISEGQASIPLTESDDFGRDSTTFLRTGKLDGSGSEIFTKIAGDDGEPEYLLPQRGPLPIGADSIFVHIGPEPEPIEEFRQTFDLVVQSVFGRRYVFEITATFSGGLMEASVETMGDARAYRFAEVELSVQRTETEPSE